MLLGSASGGHGHRSHGWEEVEGDGYDVVFDLVEHQESGMGSTLL